MIRDHKASCLSTAPLPSTINELLFFTLTVDLLKGPRPTTNLYGVRQRCTRILGTPEPRCTSLQKRRDALNLSNQHLVQSEVVVSCSNLLNNTETKTRSAIDLPWACIFDGDGSDSAVADEPDHAVVQSRERMKREDH